MLLRTQKLLRWALLTLVASNAGNLLAEPEVKQRTIYGWVEWIQLQPSKKYTKAKFDTGAKTSSMHALNIEWFEKGDEDWVRFQFSPNTKISAKRILSGKTKNFITIEAPVVRNALIKQHKRSSAERPVIHHKFILDGKEYEGEFTLTDRRRFIYPILFGRRFLQDVAIIDPAHTFLRGRPPAKQKPAKDSLPKTATTTANQTKIATTETESTVPAASKNP